MRAAFWTKHLAMLDVAATGVVVISLAAAIYRAQGIVIGLMWGIPVIAASEVCHYATYYVVSSAVLGGALEWRKGGQ